MMDVAAPAFLLLLGALTWIWWTARTARPQTRRGAVAVRCAIAALLILGASGLRVRAGDEPVTMMFLIDRSDSVPAASQSLAVALVNDMMAAMRPGDLAGVIAFGAEAVLERRPSSASALTAVTSRVNGSETNLEDALALARSALGLEGTRRMVVFSDGHETLGTATRQASMAAAEGLRLDAVALGDDGPRARPLVVTHVIAPIEASVGEPFRVSLEATGPPGERGIVTLRRDGEPSLSAEVEMSASGAGRVEFTERRDEPGVYGYHASVLPVDVPGAETSVHAGAVVAVSGKPALLYVSRAGGTLPRVLSAAGFRTTAVEPAELPASSRDLAPYAGVILDDVPSELLTATQGTALAQFVEQSGGGLLVLGSPGSLNPAGYPESPLGPLLPIDLRPRAGTRAPSLALVLLFDKTGSMADRVDGVSKIELARQAVIKVLDVLPSTDSLGVIAFDATAPVAVVPLGSSHDAQDVAERLRTIEPGGATAIAGAMDQAVGWLQGSQGAAAARRQILLISDGRTTVEDADRVRALVNEAGVEVSVVAIGGNADRAFLEAIAGTTGGRAYFPDDFRDLPLIVAREAARSSSGRIVEERYTVRAVPHPVLAGIDRASLPSMDGYTVSAARPTAETILASHLDDPVLAAWRAGLGRVGVFTADLGSPWSASMREWDGFSPLWSQVVRWLARRSGDRSLDVRLTGAAGSVQVTVDAHGPDGDFLNGLSVQASLRLPSGDTRAVTLRQSAPGRYEARLDRPEPGPYVVAVTARDSTGQTEFQAVRGFYRPDGERLARDVDRAALARLAEPTGGSVLDAAENPFAEARPAAYVEVWPWLLAMALLLFVGDILARSELRMWLSAARRSPPLPARPGSRAA